VVQTIEHVEAVRQQFIQGIDYNLECLAERLQDAANTVKACRNDVNANPIFALSRAACALMSAVNGANLDRMMANAAYWGMQVGKLNVLADAAAEADPAQ